MAHSEERVTCTTGGNVSVRPSAVALFLIALNLVISLGFAIFGLQLVGHAVAQVIQTHASTGISLFFLNGYCTTLRGANVSTITCIALFICTYHKWTVVVMCTEHNDAIVCALPDDSAAGYLDLKRLHP